MKRVLDLQEPVLASGSFGDGERYILTVDQYDSEVVAITIESPYGGYDAGFEKITIRLDADERRWLGYELLAVDPPRPLIIGEQPVPGPEPAS